MKRTVGPWQRLVVQTGGNDTALLNMQHTEYLDMKAATERLWEAMRERPDGGLSLWLDVALNGWGDDDT